MKVSVRVQQLFTAHHMVDALVAIDELRLFARLALSEGHYRRLPSGGHSIAWKGFNGRITPDGGCLTSYSTNHFERTPSQVHQKVPSRFGRALGRAHLPAGPDLTLVQVKAIIDAETCHLSLSARHNIGKTLGIDAEDPGIEGPVRARLRQAVRFGDWMEDPVDGRAFTLCHVGRVWKIARDGGTVITSYIDRPAGSGVSG